MRVYEYSKQYGIPNKELLKILQEGGFKINNHMSVLTQESINFLEKKIKKGSQEEQKKTDTPSKQKIGEKKSAEEKKINVSPVQAPKPKIEKPKEEEIVEEETLENELEKIIIPIKAMSLGELSEKLKKPVSEIILNLLKKKLIYNKNQILPIELVESLIREFGAEGIKQKEKEITVLKSFEIKVGKKLKKRLPIVVVMGHVDHGKTTLLDFIRKTRVAAKEKGGITQHLGAYQVRSSQGDMVFLDTPGHEAFSMMRMRGVRVADLVILVVAADDGIMPQTVEVIKITQSKNIPILVAINKADKVDSSRIEEVKSQLAKHNLLSEDWGGQTICVPISAKLGQGIDQLLEMIALQSEVMDLAADETINACGYVLESKIEKGLGPVATFISQHGILKVGDFFVCGNTLGKVTVLIDSFGNRLKQAGPSLPVQISGFMDLPQVGEFLQVVSEEEYKKAKNKPEERKNYNLKSIPQEAINIIIKTDNESSKEAILGAILQNKKKNKKEIYVINSGVGNISENDVILASNTLSVIYGFGVKADSNVNNLASQFSISIRLFDIIYKLLDDIQELIKSRQDIEYKKEKVGEAVVRKVFDIKGIGVIAGIYVKEGKILRGAQAQIWRNNRKIGEGQIKSLQRDKKVMKEIAAGFEGAFLIDGYTDWNVEDKVDCFIETPINQ